LPSQVVADCFKIIGGLEERLHATGLFGVSTTVATVCMPVFVKDIMGKSRRAGPELHTTNYTRYKR